MTGIKPKKILFLVYAISGFLAAIAGLFATASVMRVDVVKTGQDLEMYAILESSSAVLHCWVVSSPSPALLSVL